MELSFASFAAACIRAMLFRISGLLLLLGPGLFGLSKLLFVPMLLLFRMVPPALMPHRVCVCPYDWERAFCLLVTLASSEGASLLVSLPAFSNALVSFADPRQQLVGGVTVGTKGAVGDSASEPTQCHKDDVLTLTNVTKTDLSIIGPPCLTVLRQHCPNSQSQRIVHIVPGTYR